MMGTEDAIGVGSKAPDFTLVDDEGRTRALRDYRGKKLVLYFYPKDDTPGCTKEACGFRDSHSLLKERGAEIVGVSTDGTSSHKSFKAKHDLTFPLLSDPEGKISRVYGVYKVRSLYGRRFMGIERSTFVIDEEGRISKIFRKVRVDGHTQEVLDALT